jgi:hypothetical protein
VLVHVYLIEVGYNKNPEEEVCATRRALQIIPSKAGRTLNKMNKMSKTSKMPGLIGGLSAADGSRDDQIVVAGLSQ